MFVDGSVTSSPDNADTAGIVALNSGVIKNSYSSAKVDDVFGYNTGTGGIAGHNSGTIKNVYVIDGSERIVEVQESEGTITNVYYNKSNVNNATVGTGLSASEMQGSSASSNMSGFDFSNVWTTVSGDYPELQHKS